MQTKNSSPADISYFHFILWVSIFLCVFAMVAFSCSESLCAETGSYQVKFKGIKDKDFLDKIKILSRTLEVSAKPAGSANILRKRVKGDIELFIRFLKSEGYFNAEITESIDTNKSPWEVIFNFSLNDYFILSAVNVRFTPDENEDIKIPDTAKTGISTGKRYQSKKILDGEDTLLFLVKKQGFPHPVIEKREITADHKTKSVTVEYYINPGQKAFYGDVEFTGLENVDRGFLMKFIPWKTGDIYDPDLINKCYTKFMNLGLFSTVKITEGKEDHENKLPITIEVTERKHNSVSLGLKYHSDEGPGIKLSWENRNLFNHGEKLSFSSNLSSYLTNIEGVFKKPGFYMKEQTLNTSAKISSEETDAYTSDSFSSAAIIDRALSEKMGASAGLAFKTSTIDQLGDENSYSLLSMPLYFSLDNSNDLLDPKSGGRFSIKLIPFYDPTGESLFYSKGLINYRHYLKIMDKPLSVLAGSVTVGLIKGVNRDEIPADERFYAGGGGSVRGYPYQSLGPLSEATPLGGKALLEMSIEARVKTSRKFGFVLFMDGGSAFSEKLFDRGEEIRWGTGIGVRYFTPIGPLRFDVGIPLQKRDGIDDSYQLYISIGQAF